MGMNIYTADRIHLGKRYAAGIWCWNCRVPLHVEDRAAEFGSRLLDACPNCGSRREDKPDSYNPAFKELGFDKDHHRPSGIDGASGFIWHVTGGLGDTALGSGIDEIKAALRRRKFLVTEYGDRMPIQDFWQMFDYIIEQKASEGQFS